MPLTSLQLHDDALPLSGPKESFSDSFVKASASTTPSDDELVRAAGRNDEKSLMELYDRYAEMACGVAVRILRDQGASEDVVQAAFLSLWAQAETLLSAKTPVAGWLALTARHLALASLQGVPQHAAPTSSLMRITMERPTAVETLAHRARGATSSMAPGKQKALEIAFFDGLQTEEIASSTGHTADAIKAGIRASLLVLRKEAHA